jgi:adenylate cyclase
MNTHFLNKCGYLKKGPLALREMYRVPKELLQPGRIAGGYAAIGTIGFEGRLDYGAIGTVTNLAARLCGEASDGQILISPRVFSKVEPRIDAEPVGELTLKGFHRPVHAHNVVAVRPEATG